MSAQQQHDKRPISLDEAEEILPWYLTGRTSRAETEAIDNLLKESAELRTQLDSVRLQRQAIVDGTQEVGGPSAGNLTRLLQQIETTKQRKLVTSDEPGTLGRWLGSWLSRPVLQFALAAACVVVVVQGTLLYQAGILPFLPQPDGSPTYATASSETAPIAEALGPELLVAFRPEVTTAQLTQILNELNAVVVDGPKPGFTFVLRLQAAQSADEAITRLQSRPDLVATAQRR
ncbi:hypothetical protein [Dongia sp.]|uniref:S8 family serine peptidase n=1 Tax=Dongia sp. TaxID=1977262 RepID=UPI0035B17497